MSRYSSFFISCLVVFAGSGLYAGELSEAVFNRLHKQLQVSNKAPWRTIPWKTSLLDAQRVAVTEKKPIFIWAMDGHPLGCT
jgi:hypothetical protein